MAPVRVPPAVGVNVTPIIQFAPADREPIHPFVSAKSPLGLTPITFSELLPAFVRVTVCAGLVVPSCWLPKIKLLGERTTLTGFPVPVRLTV